MKKSLLRSAPQQCKGEVGGSDFGAFKLELCAHVQTGRTRLEARGCAAAHAAQPDPWRPIGFQRSEVLIPIRTEP